MHVTINAQYNFLLLQWHPSKPEQQPAAHSTVVWCDGNGVVQRHLHDIASHLKQATCHLEAQVAQAYQNIVMF